jgi:hypothetical protein
MTTETNLPRCSTLFLFHPQKLEEIGLLALQALLEAAAATNSLPPNTTFCHSLAVELMQVAINAFWIPTVDGVEIRD